ncbi:MAG: sigma-70 family RNA polymerase sigma factor, partial [Thermomicrobiales bacterium]
SIDAVEDVLQETFLAIWRGADRYQADAEVSAWMWGIARRQAALWYRKHGDHRMAAQLLNDGLIARDNPELTAILQADLQRAFGSLGPRAQDLARQAFLEDRPMSEIANSLNIPQGTVKSRIFNLRRKLGEALGQEHKL